MLPHQLTRPDPFLQQSASAASSGNAERGNALTKQQQADQEFEKAFTIQREAPKIGRNDPCPCGSGKKFKSCCGKLAA